VAIILTHLDVPTPQQGEATALIYMVKADPRTDGGADGFRVVATVRETGRKLGRWVSDCPLSALTACMLWIQSENWPKMTVAPGCPINPNAVLSQTPGILPLVPQGSDPNVNPASCPRLFFHLLALNFPASGLDPLLPPQLQQPEPEQRQISGPPPYPQPQPQRAPTTEVRAPRQPQVAPDGPDEVRQAMAKSISNAFRALRGGADPSEVRELIVDSMASLELGEDIDDDLDEDLDGDQEDDLSDIEDLDLDALEAEVDAEGAAPDPEPATPAAKMLPAGSVILDDGTVLLPVSLPRGYFQTEAGQMVMAAGPGRFALMSDDQAAEAKLLLEQDAAEVLRPVGDGEIPPGLSAEEAARLEAMSDPAAAEKMRRTRDRAAKAISRARRVGALRESAAPSAAAPPPASARVPALAPAPAPVPAPPAPPRALPGDLVTLRDASETTGMSISGLRKWVKQGMLTDYRSKGGDPRATIFVSLAEVNARIDARKAAGAPAIPESAAASR
jgi:hypothetical protein